MECEDWDNDGSTDFIGACSTTLGELQYATMPASVSNSTGTHGPRIDPLYVGCMLI